LEILGDGSCDHISHFVFLKLEDKPPIIATTICQHPSYLDIFDKTSGLGIELNNAIGRPCIAGAIPKVDRVAAAQKGYLGVI
jgi:hypothetical protein